MLRECSEEEDVEEGAAAEAVASQPKSYRPLLLCALGVALLVFVGGGATASLQHYHHGQSPPASALPLSKPKPRVERSGGVPAAVKNVPHKSSVRKQRLSEREREEKRLNDVKTQEIRAAQEDPTSMFDMSNA